MKTKSGYSGLTDMNMKKKSSQKKSEIWNMKKKSSPKKPKIWNRLQSAYFATSLNMKYEDFNGHKT